MPLFVGRRRRNVFVVGAFAEHRVQTEGAAPRRRRRCSDGRGGPLPSGQSHLSPVCRQHPRSVSCGGKHTDTTNGIALS